MISYLINCTVIWLVSLMVYELFLSRNTFHGYNRLYLLVTLLAGILIPLLSWRAVQQWTARPLLYKGLVYPGLEKTYEVKNSIVQAASWTPIQQSERFPYLLLVYGLGVCFMLLLLLIDAYKVLQLYRRGRKSIEDNLWVVETGRDHGPFSFLGFIFISNKGVYTPLQLQMLLAHEQRHNRLWHGADLLLVQVCKVVFWFHPLPYLYRRRICLVHEYQADSAVHQPLSDYGNFLLEQTLYAPAPAIAHSFYYSPLKKRIHMMTRKSPQWTRSKALLIVPVLAVSLLCCTKNGFSDNKRKVEGNKVTYRGNVFEYNGRGADVLVNSPDESTGKTETFTVSIDPYVVKMNGQKLLTDSDVDRKPVVKGGRQSPLIEPLRKLQPLFNQLNDGVYEILIKDIVVGKDGSLAFYTFNGLETVMHQQNPTTKEWGSLPILPVSVKNELNEKIDAIVLGMEFDPAIEGGQKVDCYASMALGDFIVVEVKNHASTIWNFADYANRNNGAAPGGERVIHFNK